MADPHILSINAATARLLTIGTKSTRTGLFKQPVEGAVLIDQAGVPGDEIVDSRFHGGPDQALYLYSQEDSDWWAEQLRREIEPGFFGENLGISHWWPTPRIGDRVRIGDLLLEITAPRVPCAKLAARVGDAQFVKAFIKAARCGAYARVLAPGRISAGDAMVVTAADPDLPTVEEVFRLWYAKGQSPEHVRRVLNAPVAIKLREQLEPRLAALEAGTAQLPGL